MSVRHMLALFLMGVFLLSTVPGLQAYVWCIKEEGSSALEIGAHSACTQSQSHSSQSAHHSHSGHAPEDCSTSTHEHEDNCELCIDVPLDTEFSKAPTPQFKKISPALHPPQWRELQLLRTVTPQLTCTHLPHPPPHISTSLLVQRTTVLII
ncbi:MAG: hypothetical protein ACQEQK_05090 [Thermodesulfobacteriota bacterium]